MQGARQNVKAARLPMLTIEKWTTLYNLVLTRRQRGAEVFRYSYGGMRLNQMSRFGSIISVAEKREQARAGDTTRRCSLEHPTHYVCGNPLPTSEEDTRQLSAPRQQGVFSVRETSLGLSTGILAGSHFHHKVEPHGSRGDIDTASPLRQVAKLDAMYSAAAAAADRPTATESSPDDANALLHRRITENFSAGEDVDAPLPGVVKRASTFLKADIKVSTDSLFGWSLSDWECLLEDAGAEQ